MTTLLVDRNMEGQADLLKGTLAAERWPDLLPVQFVTFALIGLAADSSDRVVWRFAQAHEMFLLTGNRNARGKDSLERTMDEEMTPESLPVLTIGNLDRMSESEYRSRCAGRLIEVILDLDGYRGTRRIFIP